MATVSDYLTQLQSDKQTLVDNLVAKGVDATSDETFTSLVSKVASIESGGKYAPRYISFYYYTGTELDDEISKLDTSNITTMANLFYNCSDLTTLNLTGFDTSKVTNMEHMFYGCSKLTSLDVSNFNTSNVTNMNGMFDYCSKLTSLDVSNFNTSNVTTMRNMFNYCNKLTTLNVDSFNTSNVTSMYYMFYQCQALTSLDLSGFDTSNVTNMNGMFYYCQNLTTLNLTGFDTSKVTNMYGMFYRCSELTTLAELDASSCTDIRDVFNSSSKLENFGGFKNLGKGYLTTVSANYIYYKLDLSKCTSLTHDSLMNVINNLYDIKTAGCNTQALTLGSTNLAKLTEEEIAIATNKGWTVS